MKDDDIACIDGFDDDCRGEVLYRSLPFGTKAYARCEAHYEERVEREFELRQRYPENAPADFDPHYAGERWHDDY